VIRERTGPSFEERINASAAAYRKKAKAVENLQKQAIEEAVQRAKARPCESPIRSKDMMPPSVEERYAIRQKERVERERIFAKEAIERKHRMDNREPLFKVSEVKAAFEMQKRRQAENRRRLREEEQSRGKHLEGLQEKVVHRPLLVESYDRPEHHRSAPDLRLIPNHTKETPLEAKVGKCVEQQWFLDSAWGKEVQAIRSRQDSRARLHEIPYPPKVFKAKTLGERELYPLEITMAKTVSQSWFQKSEWADKVREIKQKMDERPKLHELQYPVRPRGGDDD